MIGELRLFELLNRYGVNPKNILDLKKDKVLSYGEYKSIEYVLEYLRTYLSIKARRIELCPSILYFGVENIKANYEFLESQGFNVLKLNNCLHILSCDTLRLRESFNYLNANYKDEIRVLQSALSCPVELIKKIESVAKGDLSKKGILSVAVTKSLFSNELMRDPENIDLDSIRYTIEACKRHGINYKDGGMIFRRSGEEIDKIVEICKRYDLDFKESGTIYNMSVDALEEVI